MGGSLLNKIYFGNTVLDYFIAAGIILGVLLIIRIFRSLVLKKLKKWASATVNAIDDFIVHNIERFVIPVLHVGALYLGLMFLKYPASFRRVIDAVFVVIFTFFAIRFIALIINYMIRFYWKKKTKADSEPASLKGISTFVSIIVWGIGVVFLLDNLGFKISAVIAGLGIGGIAVALAAQAVLGDFFSYFVIFFDRPFQVGDFISVDDKSGTVESIGIKTTRVSSITGEQLIFPNSNLTNSRIHNHKRMEKRRVSFKLGVEYSTSVELLKEIPAIIRGIIEEIPEAQFDRSHFQAYGESSLIFETVYYIIGSDYNKYMDAQQRIYLNIREAFDMRGIKMAFPSRMLYLNRDSLSDLKNISIS